MNQERLTHNPFAGLVANDSGAASEIPPAASRKNRGRVDIIRQTAGRGGKTVTVITNFTGVSLSEMKDLAAAMRQACGTGGTVKDGRIEIQGDKRGEVSRILAEAGFKPVLSGG